MTAAWNPAGEWAGATVVVIGCGAGAQAAIDALRATAVDHRCVVVNEAYSLAPDADMLVSLAGDWPQAWREFAGLRVTGVEDPDLDAMYCGARFERVALGPVNEIEICHSGLTAIRLAVEMGAAKIVLAGFDLAEGDPAGPVIAAGVAAIVAELSARDIVVERSPAPPASLAASPAHLDA